ncbi:hypothetical protein C8J56DRAFT_880324 [Mycena floridula]|nr:hypothetical protein C8J56DRAFT_880324 [Mycena floridula]
MLLQIFDQVSVVENRTIDPGRDSDGYMGVRIFESCDDCNGLGYMLFKDLENFNLAAMRWHPSSLRIFDGSLMIWSLGPRFYNVDLENTSEFWPLKDGGVVRPSPFPGAVSANLFPRTFDESSSVAPQSSSGNWLIPTTMNVQIHRTACQNQYGIISELLPTIADICALEPVLALIGTHYLTAKNNYCLCSQTCWFPGVNP